MILFQQGKGLWFSFVLFGPMPSTVDTPHGNATVSARMIGGVYGIRSLSYDYVILAPGTLTNSAGEDKSQVFLVRELWIRTLTFDNRPLLLSSRLNC